MNTASSTENIDHNRRRFLGSATMTVALPTCASSAPQTHKPHNLKPPKRMDP